MLISRGSLSRMEPSKHPARPIGMTNFVWPAVEGEPEIHHITTTADGVVDRNGAFVRTTWCWSSEFPHALQVLGKVAGTMHSQGITVSMLRRWIEIERLGYATIRIDGIRLVIPVDYLIPLLVQIDSFNLAQALGEHGK